MLQNKFLFNQTSVSLEIVVLPDFSNNENKDYISIISKWKLMITDRPIIEGNLDQLKVVMDAFYSYSTLLINDDNALYESKLIDIKPENYFMHHIILKSTKPEVKPLLLKIGNAILADIINCFDQLRYSNKVKDIYSIKFQNLRRKKLLYFFDKHRIANFIVPPIMSLCSIFLISIAFIYFYKSNNKNDNSSLLDAKNKLVSIKSTKTIL